MKIDAKGLLHPASYRPSPHCDERPPETSIDMIVVHGISLPPAQFGGSAIEEFFCGTLDFNKDPYYTGLVNLKVSAHLVINRQGEITQFVPFQKRAWHAGLSQFQGRSQCNDFSIGIELEGTDTIPYEKAQYAQLAKVIDLLIHTYPMIQRHRIVGHSDIAPARKTDPGPVFDWSYLDCLLTT